VLADFQEPTPVDVGLGSARDPNEQAFSELWVIRDE
jgi:hypothetical protein